MAIKGLSIPVFGRYNNENGKVTYTEGMINSHAVSYKLSVEASENNPLHADNRVVENDVGTFSSGSLSLETDDLTQEVSKFLLGAKEVTRNYGESKTVKTLVFDDSQKSPYLGFGIIEEHQNDDKNRYKAVWLKKVAFNIPENSATTRGEAIDWQTKTIEGIVSRSDEVSENGTHPWKESAWFDSEADALEFLKEMLGVGKTGKLVVTSIAGVENGETQISVFPEKAEGNIYKYKTGETVLAPDYDADCNTMTTWNGTDNIMAASGQKILMVECTSGGKARKSGETTVVSKA